MQLLIRDNLNGKYRICTKRAVSGALEKLLKYQADLFEEFGRETDRFNSHLHSLTLDNGLILHTNESFG